MMTYEITIKYRGLGENIKTFDAISYHDGLPGVFKYWETDGEAQYMIPWDTISWLKIKEIEDGIDEQADAGA